MNRWGRLRHLARRWAQSVKGRVPLTEDLTWSQDVLSVGEWELFQRMTATDQAHAIEVARAVEASTATGHYADAATWVVSAALMHDIGKVESGAGTTIRVVATATGSFVSDSRSTTLAARGGVLGKLGRHLRYPELGGSMLDEAGSDGRVSAWAREHHEPSCSWSVPADLGRVLRDADDAAS
jgi:hypothetical protein